MTTIMNFYIHIYQKINIMLHIKLNVRLLKYICCNVYVCKVCLKEKQKHISLIFLFFF